MSRELFVIIVTYNSLKWIERCLNSVKSENIIIIDNDSTDDTVEYIKSNYPEVHLIEKKENLGFAKANNIGIAYAQSKGAKLYLLLNHDAWLQDSSLERLIQLSNSNEFGIISPVHLNAEGELLDKWFYRFITKDNNLCRTLITDALVKTKKDLYEVNFVNAACWLVSENCIQKVGYFDDKLFYHYGEDKNYCQRLHFKNLKIGLATNSIVYHDREDRLDRDTTLYNIKQQMIYFRIHAANPNNDSPKSYIMSSIRTFLVLGVKSLLFLNIGEARKAFVITLQICLSIRMVFSRRTSYKKTL